jgi:hypothetical protein
MTADYFACSSARAIVRNWINHRRRFYSLETPEIRERYGPLVARYDDWR